jgi:hypothetical protein
MTSPSSPASRYAPNPATGATDAVARPAAPWIERFARVGFAAKAVLYGIIGALALRAALGNGGRTTGSQGAFTTLVRQEWGPVVLIAMALGLFGYAAWRIAEAVLDPERKGHDAKGLALRVSYAARGTFHAFLGLQAVRLASGMSGSDTQSAESLTARALEAPMGSWLVVGTGLSIAGYGLYQLYRAWKAKLSRQLDLSRLSHEAGAGVIKVCRLGIGARGVVFVVIGGFLVRAGLDRNANQAADTGEALRAIGQQPFGPWLLGFVAAGLIAYAVYEVVQARYRVIRPA